MQERLSMRKIKDVLRLKHDCGFSNRQIARSLHVSRSAIAEQLARFKNSGLSWPLPAGLADQELEAKLFSQPDIFSPSPGASPRPEAGPGPSPKAFPDFALVHEELRTHRRLNLTLAQLWIEYKEVHPDGYQYSQFCEHYSRWRLKNLDPVMRQTHRPGEKLFVDYADGLFIFDSNGNKFLTYLWVGAWGASSCTYAEATLSQTLPAWVMSHVHAMDYFGCCPSVIVPDNLKSAVAKACFYEPDINPTYADLSNHYGFAVLPARPYHPRDKAVVENGVLVAKRWILSVLRHRTFYSLQELNKAIRELLEKLNNRPMRKVNKSRRELFEALDRPAARPLPPAPYEYADWKKAGVHIDYQVDVEDHFYSVPFRLIHERLDIRLTATTFEAFFKGERVAAHARSYVPGGRTALKEHMPPSHQKHLEWTPSRIIGWGATIGPSTAHLVKKIMDDRPYPEHGYRACMGVLHLAKHYPNARVEAASLRAIQFNTCSFKSFRNILLKGLDRLNAQGQNDSSATAIHGNIRGPKYFH
jgi:transposase